MAQKYMLIIMLDKVDIYEENILGTWWVLSTMTDVLMNFVWIVINKAVTDKLHIEIYQIGILIYDIFWNQKRF